MKVVVGLGNPGKEYANTRHNAGKMILDAAEKKLSGKPRVKFIFPDQFMNNSGPALKKSLGKTQKPADILVIHDDLDIELGRAKLSFGRSSAGHKGVESVIKALRTDQFWRLRIGVAPKRKLDAKKVKDFLLSHFTAAEQKIIAKEIKRLIEGVELWLEKPEKAMLMINRKQKKPRHAGRGGRGRRDSNPQPLPCRGAL